MDRATRMGEESISKLLVKFSLPSIFSLLFHGFYNIIDRIFIGRGIGALGLSGVTFSFPILLTIFSVCILFANGSSALISIYLGEQRKDKAENILGNIFGIITISAFLVTILGLIFNEQLLAIFSVSKDAFLYAQDYIKTIIGGSIFFFYGFTLTFIIRAEGNPIYATMMMIVGTVVNLILDPIFIFIFSMGTQGAAFATVISEAIIVIMGLLYLLRKQGLLHVHIKNLKIKYSNFKKILIIGSSSAFTSIAASIQFAFLNNRLLVYGGNMAVAAIGIIFSISSIIRLFSFGMAAGMQPIIGYNYGLNSHHRVNKTLFNACIFTFVFTSFLVFAIWIFAPQITMLFCKENISLISLTSHGMRIFLLMMPFATLHILGTRYFQATGKGVTAIFVGLTRQIFIFIPVLFIFSFMFKLEGIWFSGPVCDFLSAFITLFFIIKKTKQIS